MKQAPEQPDIDQLARAVSRLDPIEREVLLLSARDGLWVDQIAARLDLPGDIVERHLADALCNIDRFVDRQKRPWWRFW